ncbi:ABC transporter substrate-binding protein [Pseudomonas floridensis]
MDDQQQALLALRQIDQQRPQQRTVFQVQAALGFVGQFAQTRSVVQNVRPQQVAGIQRPKGGLPTAVLLAETQAQCVVLLDQHRQGALQKGRIESGLRREHDRLVPVMTLGDLQLEETRLNRQQRQ